MFFEAPLRLQPYLQVFGFAGESTPLESPEAQPVQQQSRRLRTAPVVEVFGQQLAGLRHVAHPLPLQGGGHLVETIAQLVALEDVVPSRDRRQSTGVEQLDIIWSPNWVNNRPVAPHRRGYDPNAESRAHPIGCGSWLADAVFFRSLPYRTRPG